MMREDNSSQRKFINAREVADLFGLSKSWVNSHKKDPGFPPGHKLSTRKVVWDPDQIDAYIRSHAEMASEPKPELNNKPRKEEGPPKRPRPGRPAKAPGIRKPSSKE